MVDISQITDYLYVGSRLGHEHVDEVKVYKFDLIISMIGQMAPHETYTLPPFKTVWIRAYDYFFTPISIKKLAMGVDLALPLIKNKGKVLVFCMEGKRRSVTMAAAILIAMGHTSQEAIDLLTSKRAVANPRRWYVKAKIKAFEIYWHAKQKN